MMFLRFFYIFVYMVFKIGRNTLFNNDHRGPEYFCMIE